MKTIRTVVIVATVLLAVAMHTSAEPILTDPVNFRLKPLVKSITNAVGLAADASGNLYVGYHDPADPGAALNRKK